MSPEEDALTTLYDGKCFLCSDELIDYENKIYVMELRLYLYFHQDCWEEAAGEEERDFSTREGWNEFAGKEYNLTEKLCIEFRNGVRYYYKNGTRCSP